MLSLVPYSGLVLLVTIRPRRTHLQQQYSHAWPALLYNPLCLWYGVACDEAAEGDIGAGLGVNLQYCCVGRARCAVLTRPWETSICGLQANSRLCTKSHLQCSAVQCSCTVQFPTFCLRAAQDLCRLWDSCTDLRHTTLLCTTDTEQTSLHHPVSKLLQMAVTPSQKIT